jgi:hypothetical protein
MIPAKVRKLAHSSMCDCLTECRAVLGERGDQYGEQCFEHAARIYNAITNGIDIEPEQVAMVMYSVKLARIQNNMSKGDHLLSGSDSYNDSVIDATNYLLLSARERAKTHADETGDNQEKSAEPVEAGDTRISAKAGG